MKIVTTCCRADWDFAPNTCHPICKKCGKHSAIADLKDLEERDKVNINKADIA